MIYSNFKNVSSFWKYSHGFNFKMFFFYALVDGYTLKLKKKMKKLFRNVLIVFIVHNMFMPMDGKKNWANGAEEQLNKPEPQTNEQAEVRANEQAGERTDSRITELMIKRTTGRSPAKRNERKTESGTNSQTR